VSVSKRTKEPERITNQGTQRLSQTEDPEFREWVLGLWF